MGNFMVFLGGFVGGLAIGFPFSPVFKSPRQENLDLERSDRMLRIGGAIIYSGLFLTFFFLVILKK